MNLLMGLLIYVVFLVVFVYGWHKLQERNHEQDRIRQRNYEDAQRRKTKPPVLVDYNKRKGTL